MNVEEGESEAGGEGAGATSPEGAGGWGEFARGVRVSVCSGEAGKRSGEEGERKKRSQKMRSQKMAEEVVCSPSLSSRNAAPPETQTHSEKSFTTYRHLTSINQSTCTEYKKVHTSSPA